MHPTEKLRYWLFKNRITNISFAKKLGISRCGFQRILAHDYLPGDDFKRKIEKLTQGEITYDEWLTKKVFKERRNRQ